jgi:hypothetical protein
MIQLPYGRHLDLPFFEFSDRGLTPFSQRKKKGLKKSSKRNNVKRQYATSSDEEIDGSKDIEP